MPTKRSETIEAERKARLDRLIAKYRAERDRLHAQDGPRGETLEEFGQRVFGSEAGQRVLLEYLRDKLGWTDEEAGLDGHSADGG